MRKTLFLTLAALTLAASAQSRLPPGVDGGGPAAMATRSVSQYLDLERSLATALQERRRDTVAAMRLRDLAVREFGDAAVVSFFVDATAPGKPRSTLYVVDVWRQAEHKLAMRYVSQPMHALQAPSRPRGRE